MWKLMRPDERAWQSRGGGVRTLHLITRRTGAVSFLSGITEFEPGASLPLHYHNCEEAVTIIEGTGRVEVDDQAADVATGDTVWISAGTPHRFLALSDNALRIHWTYGSVEPTRTIVESGVTVAVGSDGDRNYE